MYGREYCEATTQLDAHRASGRLYRQGRSIRPVASLVQSWCALKVNVRVLSVKDILPKQREES